MKILISIVSTIFLFGCATQETTQHVSKKILTPNSNNVMSVPLIADDGVLFKKSSIAGYQLTEADILLASAPNKPISFTTYTSDNGDIISLPSFKLRKIFKSGVTDDGFNWKVSIEELSVNVFKISGANSKGVRINEYCYNLNECFHKL